MTPDEIAKRLDNRAGYELITYGEVGLPIFGVYATALIQERREQNCIEEFALRALSAGLNTSAQIQGILGLPRNIIDTTLADLVRQEAMRTTSGSDRLTLTERGNPLQFPASDTKVLTAIPDQRRRRYMSRRSGQNGRIERKGNVLCARFWLDVPGQANRVYKSVRICPVHGPGSLNKFEQKRRLKEIIAEFGANSDPCSPQHVERQAVLAKNGGWAPRGGHTSFAG